MKPAHRDTDDIMADVIKKLKKTMMAERTREGQSKRPDKDTS